MAEIQIPRELEEIAPAPADVAADVRRLQRLKRLSNVFCGTLLLQQAVAALAAGVLALLAALLRPLLAPYGGPFPSAGTLSALGRICLIYFFYMFVPFILQSYFLRENPFRVIPFRKAHRPGRLLPALALVLFVSVLASMATNYIQVFLGFLGLQATSPAGMEMPVGPAPIAVYIFEICVLAPFCEEFIFRGMILQNLMPFGRGFAVLVSSLLFAMVHGDLLQMPLAFLVGAVFACMVIEFQSIWVSIGMHAAVNFLSVCTDLVARRWGSAAAGGFYYAVGLLSLAVCVLIYRAGRGKFRLRERLDGYRKAAFPTPYSVKRFFMTPGAVLFTLLTGGMILYYMKVV